MNHRKTLCICTAFLSLLLTGHTIAGELSLDAGWVRETPPGAHNAAAFLTLRNNSDALMHATGVQCATTLASRCEMHEHLHVDGKMRMQKVPALDIPAHGTLVFQPGGYHIMLLDLAQPLKAGTQVTIEFILDGRANFSVTLPVKPVTEE